MKPQDIEDLKQLIEFLKQYQIAEFDLERGDLKIRLKFDRQEGSTAGLASWPVCWPRLLRAWRRRQQRFARQPVKSPLRWRPKLPSRSRMRDCIW